MKVEHSKLENLIALSMSVSPLVTVPLSLYIAGTYFPEGLHWRHIDVPGYVILTVSWFAMTLIWTMIVYYIVRLSCVNHKD